MTEFQHLLIAAREGLPHQTIADLRAIVAQSSSPDTDAILGMMAMAYGMGSGHGISVKFSCTDGTTA